MLVRALVFPGCACGQFSERQSNGEHHEATEGTSPVPLGFAQTVCLFRYVACHNDRTLNLSLQKKRWEIPHVLPTHVLRAQHHPGLQ